jgi:glucan phosphoethanolaminetransferase (alkaline phosphatase superfamily)
MNYSSTPSRHIIPRWELIALQLLLLLVSLGALMRLVFAIVTGTIHKLSTAELMQAMFGGLRFDAAIAAIITLLTLFVLWLAFRCNLLKSRPRGWLVLPAVALYLMQTGDMLYARESGRHVGYEIVDVIHSSDDLWRMLPEYSLYLLPVLLLAAGLFWPVLPVRGVTRKPSLPASLATEFRLAMLSVVGALAIRSGIHSIPLSPADANELGSPERAAVALNGSYAVVYSAWNSDQAIKPPVIAALPRSEEEARILSLYAERKAGEITPASEPRRMNVVMVFLESWPAELVKSYGGDRDVAPEFDKIRAQSLTTDAMIAGGHRTVEGLFSTLCSLQNPQGQSIPGSQLLDFDYHCLPTVLAQQGWTTAFFQGGHRNSAQVGVLVEKLGTTHVYGKEDMVSWPLRYPSNSWGPQDFDLFDFVLAKKKEFSEPYFIGINTTTTHDETLPPGITPAFGMSSFMDRTESVMHFSDSAVGEFSAKVAAEKNKYPTLLVFVSDHTAHVNSSAFNHYYIVFAIYAPDVITPAHLPLAASQRDIAPTVLDALGITAPLSWAGKSLLHDTGKHFAEYQHSGHIGWIEHDDLVDFSAKDGQDMHCYHWRNDRLMQHPLPCSTTQDEMRKNALAFTQYSMSLVFSGKTTDFYTGLKE